MRLKLVVMFLGFVILFVSHSYVFAQTSDYEKAQSFVKEAEKPTEEMAAEDKLLGRVASIKIGGEPSTRPCVILNQLTFKVGDTIYMRDLSLSYKRLYQLDLFWYVQIKYEPVEKAKEEEEVKSDENQKPEEKAEPSTLKTEEGVGDIIVYVDVWQAPSYYLFPFESGGIVGDKDFFMTGKTVEAAYFQSGKEFQYWHLSVVDPQFLGSHNSATFLLSHLKDYYGVRNEDNFDLGERYNLDRDAFKFVLGTRFKEIYNVNLGFEWQDNSTRFRSGTTYTDSNKFFLSGEEFTPVSSLILTADISNSEARGYPWIKEGYSWSVGTDQALEGLGSDATFGRYKLYGTLYMPINSIVDTAVIHSEYRITSGCPPHYQKPRLGYLMRGHTSLDYFGDSTIFLSGELRKAFLDDRFQGVVFVDLGKGFDSRKISLENLDVSSGIGVRINAAKFVRLNVILRADYAWGPHGDRWTFGIGQWY